jgi:8-oxo-dGTP pyrophosphatase MutT (NUDIX family)
MNLNFKIFINSLSNRLSEPLPGNTAHERLKPVTRNNYPENPDLTHARMGSVLALFYPDNATAKLVFIKRPVYDGVHSDQIAFPGGGFEPFDRDDMDTALRETHEEIGIPPREITVIGKLTRLYIPPSNFLVNPYVGYMNEKPIFYPDPAEVEEVFSLDINQLVLRSSFQHREVKGLNSSFVVPCYYLDGRLIWGATSMMLGELLHVIREV